MTTSSIPPPVPSVTLGRSGIVTSKIGLGTANWIGRTSDETFTAIMQEGYRLGIRHFDTAPSYDQGRFSRLLKEADLPDDVVVVTKIGRLPLEHDLGIACDYSPDLAERTIEFNLKQLGLEKLPILLLHDCEPGHFSVILGKNGTADRLRKLQEQGLVGAIGIAAGHAGAVTMAAESGEFDIIQSYHLYTPLNRVAAKRIFPATRKHNLGVVNLSPFAGNILAAGSVEGAIYSYLPPSAEVLSEVRRMEAQCEELGVKLPIAALAFSLACPDHDVTVIGPVSVDELREDVAALEPPLTAEALERLASKVDHANRYGTESHDLAT